MPRDAVSVSQVGVRRHPVVATVTLLARGRRNPEVTLSTALVSIALLIAPAAYHRLNFRNHDKQRILGFGNRCVITGLGVLAVSLVSVMVLITDVLFGGAAVIIVPIVSASLLIILWALLPLRERTRAEDQPEI